MTAAAPYPGLRPFQPDEVDVFFGREEQIDQLLERLDRARLLAVVGLSGSGKSSLVKAGLVPALETGLLASAGARWRVAEMRPGEQPLRRLAESLSSESALGPERGDDPAALGLLLATLRRGPLGLVEALADTPPPEGTRLLLVVDQFEEIFRYHAFGDSDEAEAFVALLLEAVRHPELPLYVVLTMRSDFLGDCALFEGLPEALNDCQFLTPRMTREQRRAAIAGPAGVFGAAIEPVLVNRLLNDMGAEPDQLPRMQHLLMRLWNRCDRGEGGETLITVADYEAVGGFEDALSQHADEAFEELDEEGQRISQRMFRALSERGDDQRDVRRPARLGEIAAVADVPPERVAEVVEVFRRPDRSFLTPPAGVPLTAETVLDVSHESLIRQWRRLRDWVEREALSAAIYRRLAETARLWKEGEAGLWGPPDLDVALSWQERQRPTAAWAARYGGDLATATEFLAASREKRGRDEEAEQRAAIDAQEQRRVRQRNRLLTGGLLIAASLLVLSWVQWKRADEQRDLARRQAALARGGELIAHAHEALADRPQQSLLLAVEALAQERDDGVADNAPVQAIQKGLSASGGRTLGVHDGAVGALAVSRDGHWLATGGAGGTILVWDVGAGSPGSAPRVLSGHPGGVTAVAFDPEGRRLASAGADGAARVWDLGANHPGAAPRVLGGPGGPVTALAVGDGRLATGGADGAVRLWRLDDRDPAAAPEALGEHADTVTAAAFGADGRWLATASQDNSVALWDLAAAGRARRIPLLGHHGPVEAAAFTPDGRWLATAGRDNTARLWSLDDPGSAPLVLCGHDGSVVALAVSPDGEWLITGSTDATARVWRLPAIVAGARGIARARSQPVIAAAAGPGRCRHLLTDDPATRGVPWDLRDLQPAVSSPLRGHRDTVTALALSPVKPGTGLRFLATASRDHTVRVWGLTFEDPGKTSLLLRGHDGPVGALAFNPRGPWLYSGSADSSARIWNLDLEDKTLFSLVLSGARDAVRALALSEDGRWLVAGSDDNDAHLWDLHHVQPPRLLTGHDSSISAVGLSPDSRWLATASEDNTIRLWDLSVLPGAPTYRVLSGNASSVTSLAFTPDGRRLATAGRDGTARVWSLEAADPSAAPTVLCGHRDAITDLAIGDDGGRLATVAADGTARLWDLAALEPMLPTAGRAAPMLAMALDEEGCRERAVNGASMDSRPVDPGAARDLPAEGGGYTAIAFVPAAAPEGAGRLAAGDAEGNVSLFALDAAAHAGGAERTLRARRGPVTVVAASADGRWIAIGGEDDTAHLIDLAAPADDRMLVLRDHRDAVIALAFSPDGRWLATASADGEARLWDLTAEDPAASPGVLYGHQGAVVDVTFSPDGSWLATASRDHTVRVWTTYLWTLGDDDLVDLACTVAGRDLTESEWQQYLPGRPYRATCP